VEIAIVIGAVIVSFLVFTWLLKVVRATFKTAILVALTLLVLQLAFGIGPQALWEQVRSWLPGFEPVAPR
jgi:cell division protein FtsW (lipid II flippase)